MITWALDARAGYDDPVIAACQFSKFRGQDLGALGYRRLSTRIAERRVFIEFEYSALNTKPTKQTIECLFQERNGYFHIVDRIQADKNACSFLEKAAGRPFASDDEKQRWQQSQSDCVRLYADPAVPWYEFENNVIKPLENTGIYPISIVDTEMRVDR